MPRFAFEKLPGADTELTTHMKSVGEVLALGAPSREAFGKAMAGRELDVRAAHARRTWTTALEMLRTPSWDRYDLILWALGAGRRWRTGSTRPPASTPGSWTQLAGAGRRAPGGRARPARRARRRRPARRAARRA